MTNPKEDEMRRVIVNECMTSTESCRRPEPPTRTEAAGSSMAAGACPTSIGSGKSRRSRTSSKQGLSCSGDVTDEIFASYWPNAPDEERVIAASLSTKPKYVASTTLTEPLECQNSKLLQEDIAEALAALKQEQGGDLHVIGSTELVQTLIDQGLVDEFRLVIDPLLLGGGKRIFGADGALRPLRLVHSEVTTTGAILATHAAANGDRPAEIW
jgi:dihydrofolate reductase